MFAFDSTGFTLVMNIQIKRNAQLFLCTELFLITILLRLSMFNLCNT